MRRGVAGELLPEMEYCRLDLIVDGMIVEAVCWSDLPDGP